MGLWLGGSVEEELPPDWSGLMVGNKAVTKSLLIAICWVVDAVISDYVT